MGIVQSRAIPRFRILARSPNGGLPAGPVAVPLCSMRHLAAEAFGEGGCSLRPHLWAYSLDLLPQLSYIYQNFEKLIRL